MLFYLTLFFGFVYFKIFRVRREMEVPTTFENLESLFALSAFIAVVIFGFITMSWYLVLIWAFVFFLMAAVMVSAVQLGMFVDGKPILVISQVYKLMLPLALTIIVLSGSTILL